MSLRSLLTKEVHWSKRNLLVLGFLLLILPTFFAGSSILFQEVIPRDVPVAVVAESDEVTDQELTIVEGGIAVFADPAVVDDMEAAEKKLSREMVYAIVEVPPDMTVEGAEVTFTLTVDGTMVPFQEPSQVIRSLMEFQLDQILSADVTAEREVIGDEHELPVYLFPTLLMLMVIFFAFTYVPYNLAQEAAVLDRLRVEASIEALAASKLIYYSALLLIPMLVFHVTGLYYGFAVATLAPPAILALLLTFLLLSSVAMTIMVLARFTSIGQFVNIVLMLGVVGLSALAFPVGFFSSVRTFIARSLPTHYSMIITRSSMLKDVEPTLFLDWYLALVGLILVALVALKLSIVRYRRIT